MKELICPCGGRLAFKFYDPILTVKRYECKTCGKWWSVPDIEEEDRVVKEKVIFT